MDEKDELFARLQQAGGEDAAEIEQRLIKLLAAYAAKIVWLRLGEARPELVNEAVFVALRDREKFRGGSKFSTWFTAIVIHKCQDELRRRLVRRTRERPLQEAQDLEGGNEVAKVHTRIALARAMQGLGPVDKAIAEGLVAGEEYADIAVKVGISEQAVRQRWSRLTRRKST